MIKEREVAVSCLKKNQGYSSVFCQINKQLASVNIIQEEGGLNITYIGFVQ